MSGSQPIEARGGVNTIIGFLLWGTVRLTADRGKGRGKHYYRAGRGSEQAHRKIVTPEFCTESMTWVVAKIISWTLTSWASRYGCYHSFNGWGKGKIWYSFHSMWNLCLGWGYQFRNLYPSQEILLGTHLSLSTPSQQLLIWQPLPDYFTWNVFCISLCISVKHLSAKALLKCQLCISWGEVGVGECKVALWNLKSKSPTWLDGSKSANFSFLGGEGGKVGLGILKSTLTWNFQIFISRCGGGGGGGKVAKCQFGAQVALFGTHFWYTVSVGCFTIVSSETNNSYKSYKREWQLSFLFKHFRLINLIRLKFWSICLNSP